MIIIAAEAGAFVAALTIMKENVSDVSRLATVSHFSENECSVKKLLWIQ